MDNIGDWFYIVLFGVFGINALIASLFKKKGGNEPTQPQNNDPQFDSETYWETEESESVSRPADNPRQEPVLTTAHPVIPEKKSSPRYTPLSEMKKTDQPSAPIVQLENTDDLKKAIICSEILNRKY